MFFKRFFVLVLLFIFALNAAAQGKNKTIALKQILILIEKQHQVNFNYTENNLGTIKIIPPSKALSLAEKLLYLEKKTNLSFENIDNKFINIFNKNTIQSKII